MSADTLTLNQRMALSVAKALWQEYEQAGEQRADAVKAALTAGVPLNTLARELGTSRPMLRRLARD